jgi:hypothetical protein
MTIAISRAQKVTNCFLVASVVLLAAGATCFYTGEAWRAEYNSVQDIVVEWSHWTVLGADCPLQNGEWKCRPLPHSNLPFEPNCLNITNYRNNTYVLVNISVGGIEISNGRYPWFLSGPHVQIRENDETGENETIHEGPESLVVYTWGVRSWSYSMEWPNGSNICSGRSSWSADMIVHDSISIARGGSSTSFITNHPIYLATSALLTTALV